jgi:hypothetical protein
VPSAEVAADVFDDAGVINQADDAHGVLADRTAQRVNIPDSRNQVPGAGMGMRGGAVCHIRAISGGVRQ